MSECVSFITHKKVRTNFYEDDCFLECYAMWSVNILTDILKN